MLLLLLALLGIGIGGFPGGDDGRPGVTVEAESQNDGTPAATPTPEGSGPGTATPGASGPAVTPTDSDSDGSGGTPTEETDRGDEESTAEVSTNSGSNSESPEMEIRVRRDTIEGRTENVMPGDEGAVSLNVSNVGNDSGTLGVALRNVRGFENGLTESEVTVDDSGGDPGRGEGELSEELLVRLFLDYSDGDREYLFGSAQSFEPITNLDTTSSMAENRTLQPGDNATAVFEWRVPRTTGNEIQTDAIVFDMNFDIRSDDYDLYSEWLSALSP